MGTPHPEQSEKPTFKPDAVHVAFLENNQRRGRQLLSRHQKGDSLMALEGVVERRRRPFSLPDRTIRATVVLQEGSEGTFFITYSKGVEYHTLPYPPGCTVKELEFDHPLDLNVLKQVDAVLHDRDAQDVTSRFLEECRASFDPQYLDF